MASIGICYLWLLFQAPNEQTQSNKTLISSVRILFILFDLVRDIQTIRKIVLCCFVRTTQNIVEQTPDFVEQKTIHEIFKDFASFHLDFFWALEKYFPMPPQKKKS